MKKILFLTCIYINIITPAIPDTMNVNWMVDENVYDTSTCTVGDDIILPPAPTKRGHTFLGWARFFTPIEYIETTGNQRIDPQINFTSSIGYELVYQPTSINNFIVSTTSGNGQIIAQNDGYWEFRTLSASRISTGVKVYTSKFVTLKYNINSTCSVDDDVVVSIAGHNLDYNTSIFVTGTTYPGRGRIKSLKIYNNNTLVRNMIPCLDQNGVACMYDKVEDKFYYNTGTGNFIAGPAL